MSYKVILNDRAEQQLEDAYQWYAERSPGAAAAWYNGFVDSLNSLRENPDRCSLARENASFPVEVRQLLYGRRRTWRALFTIRKEIVFVFSVRHASQRDVTPDEL
jgi:plasmid stabilization system protein ParE